MKKHHRGFTLVELVVAVALIGMVTGGAIAVFLFGLRSWYEESIKNELNLNFEIATERIRRDLRLSSICLGGSMAFYPANSNIYTAISMPLAQDDDGDNLLERDASGKILWDQTVIYHVRLGTPSELVRTVFAPKNTNATPAEIYTQLSKVVAGETTSAALANEVHGAKVIFRNLVELKIRPIPTCFDGYSSSTKKENNFNFGSVVLGPGNHQLVLQVAGKNTSGTGYKLGIDKFSLSASDSDREGEIYLATNIYSYFTYSNSPGTSVSVSDMSGISDYSWSGNKQLTFTPSAVDQWLALNVYNDLWLDTSFDTPGGSWQENTSVKSDDFVSMDKGTNWNALTVFGAETRQTNGLAGNTITVIAHGEYVGMAPSYDNIEFNGRYLRVQFMGPTNGSPESLKISNVKGGLWEGTYPGTYMTNFTFSGAGAVEIAAGSSVWTDWVDGEIDKQYSYFVEFTVDGDTSKDSFAYWSGSYTNSIINGTNYSTNIFAVSKIEVRYPDEGLFRSGIFDTQMKNPSYDKLKWSDVEYGGSPPDGDVDVRVRSGSNKTAISSATWVPATNYLQSGSDNNIAALPDERCVQYETLFTARGAHTNSAELYDLMIDWSGPTGIVDLNMDLAKGTNYGMYYATVDGQMLAKGLKVEMTIFKSFPFTGRTNTVKGAMEVVPLNSGK